MENIKKAGTLTTFVSVIGAGVGTVLVAVGVKGDALLDNGSNYHKGSILLFDKAGNYKTVGSLETSGRYGVDADLLRKHGRPAKLNEKQAEVCNRTATKTLTMLKQEMAHISAAIRAKKQNKALPANKDKKPSKVAKSRKPDPANQIAA